MINLIMSPKSVKEQECTDNNKPCAFCNMSENNELKYGKIYEYEGIVTHYYCLLLSSNMQQRGRDDEGILGFLTADIHKELNRGRRLNCTYCKQKGATLGCVNKKCRKVFHYPCGIKANTLHQFFGQFKSFCSTHRPKQQIDLRVRREAPDNLICYICYEPVQRDDFYKTLWAPCCRKNGWFHRDCAQQLALSTGYFFKCPLCNNKKEFQKSMQECGIFVPCQDASWELVPNAFQELLYRHNRCDAVNCICPQGRSHTSSNAKWEMILCRTCGSQGIHVGCGKLKWVNPTWDCDECSSILQKSNLSSTNQLQEQGIITNISNQGSSNNDDDDSDSDISAGRESPHNAEPLKLPAIALKPGPRSAKLKQLHQQVETISPNKSGHTSTLEQLNDILNEQQANEIPEEMFEQRRLTSNQETGKKTTANPCVITVDDDDDDKATPVQNLQQPEPVNNNPAQSSSSLMQIKISDVTSLPPEVFANVPDVIPHEENEPQNNIITPLQSNFQDRRKPDSPSVVSRIVNRVNDYIDIPELCTKKPRMDESFIPTDGTPLHPVENIPQAYNHFTTNYSADVNANSPYIPSNGLFSNSYNRLDEQVVRLDHTKDSGLSNSDGGTGTKPADELADNVAWDAISAPELSTLPELTPKFQNSDTELSKLDSGLSTEDCGGRRSCDGSRSEEWTPEWNCNDSMHYEYAGNHRFRIMKESVLLKDLKFRICEGDDVEITVCNDYKFKITLDSSKNMDTVNTHRQSYHGEHNSARSSPVRRSRSRATNHNRIEDFSNYSSSTINFSNNIELKKPYRITTDLKDANKNHFSYSYGSTHSLRLRRNDKNELSECYKNDNNKDVAKENLVPDKFEKKCHSSDSPALGKNFNGFLGEDFPGTSRDNFKKLFINQTHFTCSKNPNNINRNKNRRSTRKNNSISSKPDIRFHVSIDLNRIQALMDSRPSLFFKMNGNLVKTPSLNDLDIHINNRNNLNTINEKKRMRSKSESSIYLSTFELDQSTNRNFIFNSKKRKKRKKQTRKKNCIERYDYCR